MEGCFALTVTASVESYPTKLRASGLGTAQIFDHIAGSLSPVIFSTLNGYGPTRSIVYWLYAAIYIAAAVPAITLKDYAGIAANED